MKPLALLFLLPITSFAADDLLLADFEGPDYGTWKTEGTAFGPGPARGALPGQMDVSGFQGQGLVNSFFEGDKSIGTLTSPEFKIERRHLRFLIGGGGWEGKTCLNLLIDGKVVRTATGPNTEPGGSEALAPASWDVAEFAGKPARLQIVDDATGGWGHLNVDDIYQTNTKPAIAPVGASREIVLEKTYLHLPVKTGDERARKERVALLIDGKVVRDFDIELSETPGWFAHLDVSAWRGKTAILRGSRLPAGNRALDLVTQDDRIWAASQTYDEPLRPQLRFSSRRGWLNDPNGMVFAHGEYHLYYQHNPYGWHWGNMHWGHAVSRDLVHWEELPIALYPHQHGDWVFSGSAVVDKDNTSGWKKGPHDLLVGAYTSTGRGECIIYSHDRGRTWTEFEGNPVVKHNGRDPRLLWHAPSKQWVMALYHEDPANADPKLRQSITFHTSPDLKKWTYQSKVPDFFECPDLFELPVDRDPAKRKWVLLGANSDYLVGTFDGKTFTPETAKLKGHRGTNFYAAQTFTHEPKGRVVQIGWLRAPSPAMPFNQSMSLSLELGLLTTPEGPRLTWKPVEELKSLRTTTHRAAPGPLAPGALNPFATVNAELLEVVADFTAPAGAALELNVRGIPIQYDATAQQLTVAGHKASAPSKNGRQTLRLYLDRTCVEAFASDGLCYVPHNAIPKPEARGISIHALGAPIEIHTLEAHELSPIWKTGHAAK